MTDLQLGEWQVDSELGRGVWATVFRVHRSSAPLERMAIKLITDPRAKDPTFQMRFQAEMAVLRRLDHPNLVKYFDHGIHEGQPYYVMDLVEGKNFETRLQEGNRPRWEEVLAMWMQMVSVLRYAHRRGILHRSLKPSNLFDCGNLQIKLSDFGILKLFTDPSVEPATAPYLPAAFTSPEQLSGKSLSKRSDFYALGTLIYTLLVGRPPFIGASLVETVQKVCFTLPERPIHFIPDLPEEIDHLIIKLLAKEPGQRPGSGTLLLSELERIWSDLERRRKLGKKPDLPPSSSDTDINLDSEVEENPEWQNRSVGENQGKWRQAIGIGLALIAILAILVWAFFFRGPSAQTLFDDAQPLLKSEKPEDWEKAWDDHLGKLAQRFPDQFVNEVKEAKNRVDAVRELRLATAIAKRAQYQSEAERFYYEGFRLFQAGDLTSARERWDNLLILFGSLEKERRWTLAASLGIKRLQELKEDPNARPSPIPRKREVITAALAHADELRQNAHGSEAGAILTALRILYANDPDVAEFKDQLKGE